MATSATLQAIVDAEAAATIARYRNALTRLQRPVKRHARKDGHMLCTECGQSWLADAPERHYDTCATGIARAALAGAVDA